MEASRGAAHLRPGLAADVRGLTGSKRLARRAAAGDERAFATIFKRHHQELYRYCLAILRNPSDAEDALQSTMSKALQALPGEGREIRLRPWLFRVAHNESIAILRERRPEQSEPQDFDPLGGVEPDAAAERSEQLRTLVSDLKALPDRQRGALVMRELSGLEYSEIAAALDCGEGAARQTVYEARVALQAREEGRQMQCEDARRAISAGDRRRLRGRKLRAHLNGCEGCRDFERAIAARRSDLAALCPSLPLAAAAGIFGAATGGGGAGATGASLAAVGGGASGVAGGLAGTAALKGASAAAALVLAAGAADATGVIDLPTPLGGNAGPEATGQAPSSGAGGAGHSQAAGHSAGAGGAEGAGGAQGEPGPGGANGAGKAEGGGPPAHSNAGGKSGSHGKETAPGQTETTPGQSGTAPGQSGSTPGQSGTAEPPGQAGTSPGLSGTTPGQSGTAPGQSSESVPPSGSATAGEGSSAPESPPGQDSAPGQSKP